MIHATHAGNEGNESAQKRHEASDDDGLAPMSVKKPMRALQMLAPDPARVAFIDGAAQPAADQVVAIVPQHCRHQKGGQQDRQIQRAHAGQSARRKQQTVTRQEGHGHNACFHKHDQEQDAIDPAAILADETQQMAVHMQNEIDQSHLTLSLTRSFT